MICFSVHGFFLIFVVDPPFVTKLPSWLFLGFSLICCQGTRRENWDESFGPLFCRRSFWERNVRVCYLWIAKVLWYCSSKTKIYSHPGRGHFSLIFFEMSSPWKCRGPAWDSQGPFVVLGTGWTVRVGSCQCSATGQPELESVFDAGSRMPEITFFPEVDRDRPLFSVIFATNFHFNGLGWDLFFCLRASLADFVSFLRCVIGVHLKTKPINILLELFFVEK